MKNKIIDNARIREGSMFEIPQQKKLRVLPFVTATIVTGVLATLFATSYFTKSSELTHIPVIYDDYVESVAVYGTLQSSLKSAINSASSGRIKSLALYPGQQVQKGDVLGTLENVELERQLIDKELSLEELKLQLLAMLAKNDELLTENTIEIALSKNKIELLKGKEKASAELFNKNIIAAFDYEAIKLELYQAELELELLEKKRNTSTVSMRANRKTLEFSINKAKAQVALLQRDIDNLKIKAGIDGVVTKVTENLELGQLFNAGESLGQISDIKNLYAELYVSGSEATHLSLDQTIVLSAQNKNITAKITNISQQVDKGTVRLDARIQTNDSFRPNTSVTGEVILFQQTDSPLLSVNLLPNTNVSELEFFITENDDMRPVQLALARTNGTYYLLEQSLSFTTELYVKKTNNK